MKSIFTFRNPHCLNEIGKTHPPPPPKKTKKRNKEKKKRKKKKTWLRLLCIASLSAVSIREIPIERKNRAERKSSQQGC